MHQHQACAGARRCRLGKGQRTDIDHRHHGATMGEHAGHPMRCLGNGFERQARQHLGDFSRRQREALPPDAEHQEQFILRRRPGVAPWR
ncbi:hypothetical protein D3C87_1728870 [compost metagenome]